MIKFQIDLVHEQHQLPTAHRRQPSPCSLTLPDPILCIYLDTLGGMVTQQPYHLYAQHSKGTLVTGQTISVNKYTVRVEQYLSQGK